MTTEIDPTIAKRMAVLMAKHRGPLEEANNYIKKNHPGLEPGALVLLAVEVAEYLVKEKKEKKAPKSPIHKVMRRIQGADDWTKRFNKLGFYSPKLNMQVYSNQERLMVIYQPGHKPDHQLVIGKHSPFYKAAPAIFRKICAMGEENWDRQMADELLKDKKD